VIKKQKKSIESESSSMKSTKIKEKDIAEALGIQSIRFALDSNLQDPYLKDITDEQWLEEKTDYFNFLINLHKQLKWIVQNKKWKPKKI